MTGTRDYIMPTQAEIVAGCRMPSNATISAADAARKEEARLGSRDLLAAHDRYFRRGGKA